MRCLILEKVLESHKEKFEYLGSGKYKFWPDRHEMNNDCYATATYLYGDEDDFDDDIASYVKYEKPQKNDNSRECAKLIWDHQQKIYCEIPDFFTTLYRWCNAKNGKLNHTYYLDDDSILHTKFVTILPDDEKAAEEVCQKAWDEFQLAEILVMMTVINECERPEPFSLKPLTEYDKMIIKKNLGIGIISDPSPEETFGNMQKQLQDEINDLKISVAAGEISAEEADAKIKELEQLMQMLNP